MKWVLYLQIKGYKMWFADIVQVGLLLATIPKTRSLHATATSLRSMLSTFLGAGGKSFGYRA
jgi:hypothetical protein